MRMNYITIKPSISRGLEYLNYKLAYSNSYYVTCAILAFEWLFFALFYQEEVAYNLAGVLPNLDSEVSLN